MTAGAPVSPAEVVEALAETALLGEFFAVTVGPRDGRWSPLTMLTEAGPLGERIRLTEAALARAAGRSQEELAPRVAASTVSLGIFARLVAPPLGCLLLTGVLPDLGLETLWWQPVLGGPVPLAVDSIGGNRPGPSAAGDYDSVVLRGVLRPLLAGFGRAGVSPVVLQGNVASALGGAASMISVSRPDLADAAWSLVNELLDLPVLIGAATIASGGRSLRRRSCCLFYRVPGGGFCGDCILTDRGAFSR